MLRNQWPVKRLVLWHVGAQCSPNAAPRSTGKLTRALVPDATSGAGDVARGRPFPHMVLRNMLELDISPVQSVVKVDATLTGIEEGLNAGSWPIGLAISGPIDPWLFHARA